jgi:hypothetical protein
LRNRGVPLQFQGSALRDRAARAMMIRIPH